MSDGTFCRICHRLIIPSMEQICVECKDAMKRAGYVKVVRCKDCKHFEPDGIYTMCYRHNGLSQNADWFCADGERKENDFWDNLSEADLMEPMHHFND